MSGDPVGIARQGESTQTSVHRSDWRRSLGRLMKSTIQQEAEKAAKKIREALEEFHRATGLSADVYAGWATLRSIGITDSVMVLDRVEVQPIQPPLPIARA